VIEGLLRRARERRSGGKKGGTKLEERDSYRMGGTTPTFPKKFPLRESIDQLSMEKGHQNGRGRVSW